MGREAEVLLEETKEIGGTEYLLGHTRDYVKLAVSVKENKKNVAIILQVCYKLSMRCALDPKGAYEKYKSFFV